MLERRLPKGPTPSLRAQVIVGAALAAFGFGIDYWAVSRGKVSVRAALERAFESLEGL